MDMRFTHRPEASSPFHFAAVSRGSSRRGSIKYVTTIVAGASVAMWSVNDGPVQQFQHWTAEVGLHVLSEASMVGVFGVSPDGSRILYTDNANGSTADLVVAHVDGSEAKHVLIGTSSQCLAASFQGNTVVAQSCPANNGGISATLSVFAPPSYAERDVATGLGATPSLALDGAGEHAFVASSGGAGSVVSLTTGAESPIASGVSPWYLTHDANAVLYANSSAALIESSVSDPSPIGLVSSGATGLLGVSDDEARAAYFTTFFGTAPTGGNVTTPGSVFLSTYGSALITDLYLTPTAPAGGGVATVATGNAIYQGFTTDSRALVYQVSNPTTGILTLNATTRAGVTTQLSANSYAVMGFGPGGTVAGFDNATSGLIAGLGSVHVSDLTKGGAPVLAASWVNYATLDATGTQVIYGATFPVAGLYAAPAIRTGVR